MLKNLEIVRPFDKVQKSSKLPVNVDYNWSKTNSIFFPLKLYVATFWDKIPFLNIVHDVTVLGNILQYPAYDEI